MFSKHQTSTTLLSFEQGNRATLPLSCSLCAVSTSTPKPRAEGSSPSAPAKNREASTMLASLFFVSAHKDSATRHGCALRSACRGVSERQWRSAANRPRRQPRQVLLPLPQNRRKHWVSAGFLFACVAWEWGSFWFGHWVFSSGLTRSQLFPSPPAPKTHPVSPFLDDSGCVFLFFAVFLPQNFCLAFCATCRIVLTS